ncbi:MAG: hypothetical protein ACREEC_09370, partial [Thermoplasmata archaeon]
GSGLSAGSMNFVVKTATGATDVTTADGGFTIYNSVTAMNVAAATQTAVGALSTTWISGSGVTVTGSTTTQLASTMIIVIDLGTTSNPSGTGLVFSALGVGSYSGTVSVALP